MNGCRWKIGNGRKIKIMSEPWLRGDGVLWMPSPSPQKQAEVAEVITSMPLLDEVVEDQIVWQEERH
ncbi:hypothetical protein A2U01_0038810, partial [Trifolium medium]|nr:hypothetical protein [Trifolium medium]